MNTSYFDPSHVTDELEDGEVGQVHVGRVLVEGVFSRKFDFQNRKRLCVLSTVVGNQILRSEERKEKVGKH